jgi:hypothetical protein
MMFLQTCQVVFLQQLDKLPLDKYQNFGYNRIWFESGEGWTWPVVGVLVAPKRITGVILVV